MNHKDYERVRKRIHHQYSYSLRMWISAFEYEVLDKYADVRDGFSVKGDRWTYRDEPIHNETHGEWLIRRIHRANLSSNRTKSV